MAAIIEYGIKNENLIHISQVESGLNCNCTCICCGERLIANKGVKNIHHFSHKSKIECENIYETHLHYLAKDIIEKEKNILLPIRIFQISSILELVQAYNSSKIIGKVEFKKYELDEVILERKVKSIIPDIKARIGDKLFFIEIAVTSFIKDEKLKRIEEIGIPTLEIDLSSFQKNLTRKELKNILLSGNNNFIKWKYNLKDWAISEYLKEVSSDYLDSLIKEGHVKKVTGFKKNPRVSNCPKKYSFFTPKYYEERKEYNEIVKHEREYNDVGISECLNCEFLFEYWEDEQYIICLGNKTISQKKSFYELNDDILKANNFQDSSELPRFKLDNYIE